jgi:hypothetical protein
MGYAFVLSFAPVMFYAGYGGARGKGGIWIDWKNAEALRSGWWTMNLYIVPTAIVLAVYA